MFTCCLRKAQKIMKHSLTGNKLRQTIQVDENCNKHAEKYFVIINLHFLRDCPTTGMKMSVCIRLKCLCNLHDFIAFNYISILSILVLNGLHLVYVAMTILQLDYQYYSHHLSVAIMLLTTDV